MILTEYNEELHEETLRREGREEEREKMAEAVRNLMEKLNLTAEEAMELLGLSEEDRERYRTLL